jgi:nitrite reductase (cytochrome c-552)
MLNINRACQGCHHFPEDEMKSRVEQIQTRFAHSRDVAMDAVVELIKDIEGSQGKASDADLNAAREFQRKAQFFLDYVEAENSMGFHAVGESLRILTDSTDLARKGQLALRGYRSPPPMRAPGRGDPAARPEQKAGTAPRSLQTGI